MYCHYTALITVTKWTWPGTRMVAYYTTSWTHNSQKEKFLLKKKRFYWNLKLSGKNTWLLYIVDLHCHLCFFTYFTPLDIEGWDQHHKKEFLWLMSVLKSNGKKPSYVCSKLHLNIPFCYHQSLKQSLHFCPWKIFCQGAILRQGTICRLCPDEILLPSKVCFQSKYFVQT